MKNPQDAIAWAIAYDVSDDRARGRMARALEKHGVRVQGSVFEARLTQEAAAGLLQRLSRHCGPGDSLRFYALPANALARCLHQGGAPMPEDGPFWIL